MTKRKVKLKKAENEGVLTINKTANDHISSLNTIVSDSTELIDKLIGTTSITNSKQQGNRQHDDNTPETDPRSHR